MRRQDTSSDVLPVMLHSTARQYQYHEAPKHRQATAAKPLCRMQATKQPGSHANKHALCCAHLRAGPPGPQISTVDRVEPVLPERRIFRVKFVSGQRRARIYDYGELIQSIRLCHGTRLTPAAAARNAQYPYVCALLCTFLFGGPVEAIGVAQTVPELDDILHETVR